MKTTHRLWFLLMAVLMMGLLAASIFLPSPRSVAYADRPTPTSVYPAPAGAGLESERGPEPPHNGTVSGIVFNYSANQPQGGIGVVLDGGGWAAETVSEFDGRYTFQGLGRGPATLRLHLPEGATPVNPDLPVHTDYNLDVNANLGYYTGDQSPVPVLLTAECAPVKGAPDQLALNFQVENRWAADITGVVVDAQLPAGQQIISAQVSQGQADAAGLRAQMHLGSLAKEQKASVNLLLNLASPEASGKVVRATLTYDQQATSQIVDVVVGWPDLPVTGGATAQNSLSSLLLSALVVAAFGYTAVLMAKPRVKEPIILKNQQ